MPDITTVWNTQQQRGDWAMAGADLQSGSDLQTSILISLLSDRVAQPGYVPPVPGDPDPKGWWGDAYLPQDVGPLGSRLWQLRRAEKTQTTLNDARDMMAEALQWMITRKVVASFDILAWWLNGTYLAARIVAHRPGQPSQSFPSEAGNYAWAWDQMVS